jgi:hypothetical protein
MAAVGRPPRAAYLLPIDENLPADLMEKQRWVLLRMRQDL